MSPEQAKGFLTFFLTSMENEHEITKRVIAAVPQDTCEYKPDQKSMTGRELAFHIAGADIFFMDSVINGQFDMSGEPPKAPPRISDILSWYETNYADRVAQLKALPAEKLTHSIKAFGAFELPAVMYLNFMLMHMAHHRGQLSAYLRPMGSKVPRIYGGSADEPFEMPAQA
jgi:uncharacterized damage-inducible protein DinB